VVSVREAATVVLVRDRPGLEVLMLRRNPGAVFSPGATVFAGGAVDAEDRSDRLVARVIGADDVSLSAEMSVPSGALGFAVAAVRECFEEAGLLLARDRASRAPLDVTDSARRARLASLRHDLNAHRATFADVLEEEDAVIDPRDLHLFAHWLTPLGAPRRYDTWFFVARAPLGDDGVHDDSELVASAWTRPSAALQEFRAGEIELIFPTMRTLSVLSQFDTAVDAIDTLRHIPRDSLGRLPVVRDGGGERVHFATDVFAPAIEPEHGWTVPLPDLDHAALAREGVA
jgi:8-oxo-dGTP pyrophosphatase MutT (NUDIX family)